MCSSMRNPDPANTTPEHVASTWRRLLALGVDSSLHSLSFAAFLQAHRMGIFSSAPVLIPYLKLFGFLIWFFAFQFSCLYWVGATPGKLLMGLRIVDRRTGSGLLPMQAFLRVLADSLSVFLGFGPRALALLRFDRTHVSDWVAETQVRQFVPRDSFPRRRVILGVLLFLLLSWSGLMARYQQFIRLEWKPDGIAFSRSA
ncbi:MAG: RDD family protein [Bdellovibrio sp.]